MVVSAPGPHSRESERLQHILLHAAPIFAEQGYERASIREISRATRVSLSGLCSYFSSKQKLLFLTQADVFTLLINRPEERLGVLQDPAAPLRVVVQKHIPFAAGAREGSFA